MGWLNWFVSFAYAITLALLIMFVTFVLLLLYVFGNKRRGSRLESYKDMPFRDEKSDTKEGG